jgi:D-3-phosphoglycerate dehydrogenase
MALLLAVARKVTAANKNVHAGQWDMRVLVPMYRLRGSTFGLVGFGRIPQLLTPKAKAFGLNVVACDPYIPGDVLARAGVRGVSFDELLKVSDYISIHSPLLPETQNLFNADVFKRMKPTAYLINTARGPIVDEAALAEALDAGQLAGAALDVMAKEPPIHSPLVGRENVILTPHTSFYSEESLVELQTKAADEVARVLTQQAPRNPVNPEAFHAGHHTLTHPGA